MFLLCRNSTTTESEVIGVRGTLRKANLHSTKTQPVCLTYLLLWNSWSFIKWQVIDFFQHPTQAFTFIFTRFHLLSPALISICCTGLETGLLLGCPVPSDLPSGCWPSPHGTVGSFTGQEVLQFPCLLGISFISQPCGEREILFWLGSLTSCAPGFQ